MKAKFTKNINFDRKQIKEFLKQDNKILIEDYHGSTNKTYGQHSLDDTIKSNIQYNDIEMMNKAVINNVSGWKVDQSDKMTTKLSKGPYVIKFYIRKNEGKLSLNELLKIKNVSSLFEEYDVFDRNKLNFHKSIIYTLSFINADKGDIIIDHNGEKIGEIKFIVKLPPSDSYFQDKVSKEHQKKINEICIKDIPHEVKSFLAKFESLKDI